MKASYYSHGKLLISGEYLVLDGATALAVPTRQGQSLRVSPSETATGLEWVSRNPDGSTWFETRFENNEFRNAGRDPAFPADLRARLLYILTAAAEMNPGFLVKLEGARAETQLEFPREWGLGSSSTLISNLAFWADIDPYALLEATLGGSGYDIAAARSENPFFYSLTPQKIPVTIPAPFFPPFADTLFFVYLNQKQDSREGIARYRKQGSPPKKVLDEVSGLSEQMARAANLEAFRKLIDAHEILVGEILGMEPVKNRWFGDYPGSIKSLGAWGGDFILATGKAAEQDYFRKKGYQVIRPYREFIL